MLKIPEDIKVYIYNLPTDMRCSFNRLSAMVKEFNDPLSGDIYVFINRRKDKIKLLYWDSDGYAIWYKRLERGLFKYKFNPETGREEISGVDLKMLLSGMEFERIKFRRNVNQYAA